MLLATLVMVLLVGCSTQQFGVNGRVDEADVANVRDSNDFFVYGIGQSRFVDAAKICGSADKVLQVQAKQTFLNGFLGAISFGIYTPREYSIYCKR
jgi:hypothetical protein